MGDAAKPSVLKRKAKDGLIGHKARSMSPEKAMRLGMALAAQNGMELACEVSRIQRSTLSHETLVGMLDSDSLLAILEGVNGARAALAIDGQMLAGLVEHQTLGRVLSGAASPRKPTLVDAALVTPFVEDTLARFVNLLSTDEAPAWLQHYKFGAVTEDTRTLSLSLKAHEFHFLMLDVSLEGGAKSGTIGIAFPDFEDVTEEPFEEEETETGAESLQAGMLQANATLTAVIGRLNMTIGETQTLRVGDVLTLPMDGPRETTLETVDGARVTAVNLGQINGMRAVRMVQEGADDVEESGEAMMSEAPAAAPRAAAAAPVAVPEPAPMPAPVKAPEIKDLNAPMEDLSDLGDLPELDDMGDFNFDDIGAPD
ncbi:MAG: FliM/FliN family flagellar motor switch protein, partial [Shimia sp.]|uniref:FliM/FliN family flagellar motor switch protein n=1 Tax=Shimia sp. TaxID=1954381 RepID=UPI00405A39B9